jgi:hypothetical protein
MANPSPTCEVRDGAGAYAATAGGVDVTVGNTITIRLSSQTDVDSWLIQCATTDDTSDAGTVTASLSIDATLKTATFTAPAAGKAYRFRSRVNQGIDRNGVAQASYETTFCIYTLVSGRRVMAADETTEGNATFGWIVWLNDMIRDFGSGGGGSSAVGGNYQVQYYDGGSFAGATGMEYDKANLRPLLRSPLIGGTAVFTGTDVVSRGLSDSQAFSVMRRGTTTDATVTPVFAWKVKDEAVSSVVVEANAIPSGGAAGGSYARRVTIRSDGGTATCGTVESSWNDEHTASGVGFTGISVGSGIWIGASGATGFVNVKGPATGVVKWGVTVTVQETSWA